jgi:hypothetical protein
VKLSEQERKIITTFFADKPVKRAFLFGSYARGDANTSSDIDLLIEWDYNQPIGWKWISYWKDLQTRLQKKVDLVSDRWLDPQISSFIHHDKELIYERE